MTSTSTSRNGILLHLPALRAFAIGLSRSPDTADDLVQETVVRAWTHFDRFTPGTNLRAWLFTILRNEYLSSLRRRWRYVPDPDDTLRQRLSVGPSHDCALAFAEFRQAFARISPEHREALILVGALGYSYEEAAKATALAIGTLKSRVSRARASLGECPLPAPDAATLAAMSHGNSPHFAGA